MNNAPNMHVGTVKSNHGGHEIFDLHEILGGTINVLDQYMMFRQYVQSPELLTILDRQYQFMTDEYNMLVQAFSTGQDPQHGTKRYQMTQHNESIVYGMQPSQPKKPKQSVAEVNDEGISASMLGLLKSMAGSKTLAACEATNPVVRRVLADSIPNCIEMAYEIFLYQNKNQYYQVPQLAEQDQKLMQNAFAVVQGQLPQAQSPQHLQGGRMMALGQPSSNPMIHGSSNMH